MNKLTCVFIFLLAAFQCSLAQNGGYDKERDNILKAQSSAQNAVFDQYAVAVPPPKKGQAYAACNDFPGVGYVCRAHRFQCCGICGSKYAAGIKAVDADYNARLAAYDKRKQQLAEAEERKMRAEEDRKQKDLAQKNQQQIQASKQQEQRALAQQRAAESSRRAAEMQARQLQLLTEQKARQEQANEQAARQIDGIADAIIGQMIQKAVREDNAAMDKQYKQLEDDLKTKKGVLADCARCNGQGAIICSKCGGVGYVKDAFSGKQSICYSCRGKGKEQCLTCSGTGKSFKESDGTDVGNAILANDNTIEMPSAGTETPVEPTGPAPVSSPGISLNDCLTKAEQFEKAGDMVAAFKWNKTAADWNPSKINTAPIYLMLAQYKVAEALRSGKGTTKNMQQARIYYESSATGGWGFQPAMIALGRLYENGEGGEKNEVMAAAWYQKAINRNFDAKATQEASEALAHLKNKK